MEIPVKPNSTKVATKWALIYLITSIVITYAVEFSKLDPQSPVKYVTWIPFVAFLLLAQKEFREQLGGYLTFNEGFSAGFRFAFFSGFLLAIFTYLYLAVLSPGVWQKAMEITRTQMESKNNMTDTQVDTAMNIMKKWGPIMGAFGAAVMYAILGAIIALIGAAIFKKERSPYDIAQTAIDPNEVN